MSTAHFPTANTSERLHGLDAVRAFALLLGICLHASMSFLPGAQYFWVAHDSQPSAAIGLLFYVPHMFRMILFFLLAGFFARMGLERLGVKGFARDRWSRIALPLLAGWPLVFAAFIAVLAWGAMLANGGVLPKEAPPGPAFTPESFPLTHLWFLYALLLAYIAALLMRGVVALIDKGGRVMQTIDRVVRGVMGPWAPLLLAMPLTISLWLQPKWFMWFGIPTPDQSLYPNLAALVGFGGAFALGWLLHRQADLLQVWSRRWPLMATLAVACTVACLSIVGLAPALTPAVHDVRTLLYIACYSVAAWTWTFALIGLALRFLSGHSPALRYVADASYWMYLIHLPLVMALQVAVAKLDWPAPLKLLVILFGVFAVMLTTYHWLVRNTWLGAWLNGRRKATALAAAPSHTKPAMAHAGAEEMRRPG